MLPSFITYIVPLNVAVLLLLGGCAAQTAVPDSKAAALPWWVASPSAPLPAGFPAPGPVGQVVIKQYPSYREAVNRQGQGASDRALFNPLFNHIEKNQIQMTSPVELTYSGPRWQSLDDAAARKDQVNARSMAFIYGNPEIGRPGEQGPVDVVERPAMTVASLAVTGSYSEANFQKGWEQLSAWLREHQSEYQPVGEPRVLAYNSPFTLPFTRLAEVQVEVKRK